MMMMTWVEQSGSGPEMSYDDVDGDGGDDVDDKYDDDDLGWAIWVRARDVVGSLHHLERYVLLHALQQRITNYSSYLQSNVHIVTK